MTRIYPDYAYSDAPRESCWWDETCAMPDVLTVSTDVRTQVAVIGAGFTGLSAALHLAEAGCSVVVLDEHAPGWGASGRNGGFCCLGGAKISDATMDQRYGKAERQAYRRTEADAVKFVEGLLDRLKIDADTHSKGETVLAHRAKDFDLFEQEAHEIEDTLGVTPTIVPQADLAAAGMAGPFFGAMTIPIGFGLNPRKYVAGLVSALQARGGQVFGNSGVRAIERVGKAFRLNTTQGSVRADRVIIATNGYSSDSLHKELSGRYLPTQSNVLVTRPLSDQEIETAGWSSDQMAYDTRNLLHYFRLMPDRRFLFGMRGGLRSGAKAEASARAMVRRDFERMFPAWKTVPSAHSWSGLVCLTRSGLPFAGDLTGEGRLFAAFGYHGNGVAMGSYIGARIAEKIIGNPTGPILLRSVSTLPNRFPLGRYRRALLPPAYALKGIGDI
jgi:glycine/D-amino acid oxidase-like deaminating enzyme